MPKRPKTDRQRTANILGAFALGLTDKIAVALHDVGNRSETTSAAVIQIGAEPGLSIESLRNCLALSHSATVRLVDGLQVQGLVQRQRDKDGDSRVAILSLTHEGEAQMRKALAAREEVIDRTLAHLTDDELHSLTAILERVMPKVVSSRVDQDVVCRLCDLQSCPQDRCPVCVSD